MAGQRRIEKSQTPHSPSPRAPDLAPQRERPSELDTHDGPGLRAPARVQHHAPDAVDAEPGVPEAGVGVAHFPFGPRGSTVSSAQGSVKDEYLDPLAAALSDDLRHRWRGFD
jgi:hypothetical protein